MSDATVTVVSGVLVLVIGQILQRFLLEPMFEQRRIISQIAHAVTYYANFHSDTRTKEEIIEAMHELRGLASSLRATIWIIPLYRLWALLGLVRRRKAISDASRYFIGWSNSLSGSHHGRTEHHTKIREALNLQWLE